MINIIDQFYSIKITLQYSHKQFQKLINFLNPFRLLYNDFQREITQSTVAEWTIHRVAHTTQCEPLNKQTVNIAMGAWLGLLSPLFGHKIYYTHHF